MKIFRLANMFWFFLPFCLHSQNLDTLIFEDKPFEEIIDSVEALPKEKVVIQELPKFYGPRGISYDKKKHISTLWDLKTGQPLASVPYKVFEFTIPHLVPYEEFRQKPPGNNILFQAVSGKKRGLLDEKFRVVYPVNAKEILFIEERLMPCYFGVLNEDEKVRYLDSSLASITTEWSKPSRFWPGGAYYFPVKSHKGVSIYDYSGTQINKRPYKSHTYIANHVAGYERMYDKGGVHAIIGTGKRYGLLSPEGSVLVKMRYDSILASNATLSTYALLFKNGKGRLYDTGSRTCSKVKYEFGVLSQQLGHFIWNSDEKMNARVILSKSILGILRHKRQFYMLTYNGDLSPLTELPPDTPKAFLEFIGWEQ